MIIGTTLLKLDGNPYFSPVFPRGGGSALFGIDVTQILTANVTFTVQHKNTEDTGWASVGVFGVISSVNPYSLDVSGLKEQIRIMVTFAAGDPPTAAIHFLIQTPSWRPY